MFLEFFIEHRAQAASLLGHPPAIRVGCHASYLDTTRVDMDEKQHVVGDRPPQRPDGLRDEVSGPEYFDVPLDEV